MMRGNLYTKELIQALKAYQDRNPEGKAPMKNAPEEILRVRSGYDTSPIKTNQTDDIIGPSTRFNKELKNFLGGRIEEGKPLSGYEKSLRTPKRINPLDKKFIENAGIPSLMKKDSVDTDEMLQPDRVKIREKFIDMLKKDKRIEPDELEKERKNLINDPKNLKKLMESFNYYEA